MNYKLIVFDLDGTLLTSGYELLPSTLKAIADIRNLGLKISVATGRSYKSAEPFLKKLEISEPMALCNGAVINDPRTGISEVISGVPRQNALTALKLASEFGASAKVHLADGTLYKLDDAPWPDEGEHFEVGTINPGIKENLNEDPVKIVLYGLFDRTKDFERELNGILDGRSRVNVFRSSPQYTEVINKAASKGKAAVKLGEMIDVALEEIIGVGDYDNDYELLRDSGLGIMVGKGTPKLKEVAQHRIPKPEELGIEELRNWLRGLSENMRQNDAPSF